MTTPNTRALAHINGEILTPIEAAELLKVERRTVIRLIQRGELVGRKVGREYRTMRTAVDNYMHQR